MLFSLRTFSSLDKFLEGDYINTSSCFRVNSRHTLVDKGSLGIEIRSFVLDVPQEDRHRAITPVVFSPQSVVRKESLKLMVNLLRSRQTSTNHEVEIHLQSVAEFRVTKQGDRQSSEEVN